MCIGALWVMTDAPRPEEEGDTMRFALLGGMTRAVAGMAMGTSLSRTDGGSCFTTVVANGNGGKCKRNWRRAQNSGIQPGERKSKSNFKHLLY